MCVSEQIIKRFRINPEIFNPLYTISVRYQFPHKYIPHIFTRKVCNVSIFICVLSSWITQFKQKRVQSTIFDWQMATMSISFSAFSFFLLYQNRRKPLFYRFLLFIFICVSFNWKISYAHDHFTLRYILHFFNVFTCSKQNIWTHNSLV